MQNVPHTNGLITKWDEFTDIGKPAKVCVLLPPGTPKQYAVLGLALELPLALPRDKIAIGLTQ